MTTARPTRIGKYEVEAVVGEGAMGVVYRAMDPMLNRRVAIKVMSDAVAQNHDLRERFLREAQAAGSLQHPNVVTIYDFGDVDGHLYIAMEYVEGDDLEDLMMRKVELPLDAKLELIIGVLHGLAFAHKRGVVHRDVKPANIRVDEEGKARLMDFGVAHLASSDMTATGVMLGTPSYMAPEQILGGPVTPATDIFSVGAVLYELLTDARPFRGDTLQSLMYQILSRSPAPLTATGKDLPEGLNDIVMRALQKEAKDRYHDATEMADDLATIRSTGAEGGKRTSLSLRATIDSALAGRRAGAYRRMRRKRQAMLAAGVVAIAAVAVGGYEVARQGFADPLPSSTGTAAFPPEDSSSVAAPRLVVDQPPADAGSAAPDSPPAAPVAPPTSAPSTPGPSAREISLARAVQRTALGARRRAAEAGADAEQLRAGDAHNDEGEALIARGRVEDAAASFNHASAAWNSAELAARSAVADRVAAAPTPAAPSTTVSAPRVIADSGPARAGAAVSTPPPPQPAGAASTAEVVAPQPARNNAAEIAAVIVSYARAIETRDISELRRVYPGMTSDQRRAFEDFFRSTRSLRATLAVDQLQVSDTTAEARLSGTYEYVTSAGQSERRQVGFVAGLRLDAQGWRLVAVR